MLHVHLDHHAVSTVDPPGRTLDYRQAGQSYATNRARGSAGRKVPAFVAADRACIATADNSVSLAFTCGEPSTAAREPMNIQPRPPVVGAERKEFNMTRTIILTAAGAAATLAVAAPADAQRYRNWRTIAYTTVNGHDRDTIRVPGTARYRQMRVCVYGGPINMRDVDVRFRNGGHQDIGTRSLMRAGTCTRTLDLRGRTRDVTQVRMKYAPLARGWVRPVVRVQAR
jgi:hypothetical protein